MISRPMPDETWSEVAAAIFSREPRRVEEALITMGYYSYDPRVRDQLRRIAEGGDCEEYRQRAIAVLRRQRSVDLGQSFMCAACCFIDPRDTEGLQRRVNEGVLERRVCCTRSRRYVWPSLDKCYEFKAASTDVLHPRARRRPSPRNPWV